MQLVGRERERERVRALLDEALAGRGNALVVRGEAGMGKTALLADAVASQSEFTVTRLDGIESEMELPYAGLHRLLLPFTDVVDELPQRQRNAVRSAFGTGDMPEVPDRFAVGLATLSILDRAATRSPLLCVVDDVQWVDRDSLDALALAGRRLGAERVAMLFSGREDAQGASLDGLPVLQLDGLATDDALSLVRHAVDGGLPDHVAANVVRATGGTPLAILELGRAFSADQLSWRTMLPEPLPIGRHLEAHFLRAVADLPERTQTYLLLVAAEPSGDTSVVSNAAATLGVSGSDADPAVDCRLLTQATPPVFRHPLIRSAIYRGATAAARRLVHTSLANATVLEVDADRRAWHLAAAAEGVDESVARDLESSAARARARGGHAAAGIFLSRAAELTPDRERRAERVLAAATSHLAGGQPTRARALLDGADLRFQNPVHRAHATRLEGAIGYASGDMPGAIDSLMRAARTFAEFDVPLARRTLLQATAAARFAGVFAPVGGRPEDIARAARHLRRGVGGGSSAPDLLLEAYESLHLDGIATAMPVLRRALGAVAAADANNEESLLWLEVGAWVASTIADDEALYTLSKRLVDEAREQGALVHLAHGLLYRAMSSLLGGSMRAARLDFSERAELLAALGVRADVGAMILAAWAGQADETRSRIADVESYAIEHELGWMLVFTEYARAILGISFGNYEAALAGASTHYDDDSFLVVVGFPNIIEALARAGRIDEAQQARAVFAEPVGAIGGTIGPGLLARVDGLLDDAHGEQHFRNAIRLLESTSAELQLARANLLYGEWLRRRKRLTEARVYLRTAHESFTNRGLAGFAARARIELQAAGETVGPADNAPTADLTAQEAQVARLAADGLTNQEIASKLFLSASTVDYHLRKVFRKLGISTRRRLREVLA